MEIDKETIEMLYALGMSELPGLVKVYPVAAPLPPVEFRRCAGACRRYVLLGVQFIGCSLLGSLPSLIILVVLVLN
ncbi:hypothetical protein SLA2020_409110 [Shorea laevis]